MQTWAQLHGWTQRVCESLDHAMEVYEEGLKLKDFALRLRAFEFFWTSAQKWSY